MKKLYFILGLVIICISVYFYFTTLATTEKIDHPDTHTSTGVLTDKRNEHHTPKPTSTTKDQLLPSNQASNDYSSFLPQAQTALKYHPLLNGTELLENWQFTENKQLIIDSNVKDTFDYLLVVYPQVGKTGVMALAQHTLHNKQASLRLGTQQKQANEALLLNTLERYIDYQAQAEQQSKQKNLDNMQNAERLELLNHIRKQYLGPDLAHAFYAQQEIYDKAQQQN